MDQEVKFVYTLDHSDVTNKAKDIKQEIHQNAKEVEKLGVTTDEFAKTVNALMSSFGKLTTAVDRNTEAQKKTGEAGKEAAEKEKRGADAATQAIRRTKEETDTLGGSFGKLTKYAAGFFTLQAAQGFIKKVFDARSEIQSLEASFETLVGDSGKAAELFGSIREFAVNTPMEMKDLASAAQTMMSFNIPVEQVMENLKALGDVSMGDAQKFQSLSLAFSQMSATGKLMGQDLLQMINAGFNPLATMSEKTGKSISELKDEMSKGAISADMVRQAFIDATSEGGKFHGMLEAQSKTLRGQWSNLQGAVSDALNSMGEQSEGVMTTAMEAATYLVKHWQEVVKVLGVVAASYGTYKAAVMAVTAVEKVQAMSRLAHIKGMTLMQLATDLLTKKTAALNATMLANPYVLCATAIAGLVSALVLFTKHTNYAEESQKKLNETFAQTQAEIASEQKKIDDLFDTLRKAKKGTDEYKTAKDNILSQYGQYLNGLSSEVSQLNNVEAAYKAVSRAARDAAMARGMEAAMQGAQDSYNERYSENYDKIRAALAEEWGEDYATRTMRTLQRELQVNGRISDKNKQALKNGFRGTANYGNIETWVSSLNNNERDFNESRRLAREKFGNPESPEKTVSDAKAETKRTKSVVEEEKKKAQAELDSLTVQEAAGKKGAALRKKIASYDEELKSYSASGDKKAAAAATKADTDARRQAEEAARKRQQQYDVRQKAEERNAEQDAATQDAVKKAWIAKIEDDGERERAEEDEQHRLNKEAIKKRADEMKKARLDAARAEWESVNTDKTKVWADTETAKKGLSAIALSKAEQEQIDAEWAEEESRWRRVLNGRREAEEEAMRSYLKQYGDYEQQRQAISEEYDKKIRDAKTEGDRLMLSQQKDEELRQVDERFGLATQAMSDLFADASKKSVGAIQQIIDKYDALVRYMEGHKGTASRDDLLALGFTDEDIQRILRGDVSIKELTDRLKALKEELKQKSPYQSFTANMDEAIKKIKEAKTTAEKANAFGTLAASIQDFLPAVKEFGSALSNIFGKDDSQFASAIDGLDGMMTAGQGVAQMMSGDIVGGAMAAVQGVSQVVDALDGMFGADYSSYNALVEQYDRLIGVWDTLIDRKSEYIDMSYGAETIRVGREALDLIEKQAEAYRTLGRERLNAGASAGSHSIGRRLSQNTDSDDWASIAQSLGWSEEYAKDFIGTSRMTGLFDLTAEQIRKLQEGNQVWWAKMDDDVRKYLESIIDNEEKWKATQAQIREQLTTTTEENVFSGFLDDLYSLADGSEDVFDNIADNWQQMVNKMVVNNLVGQKFQESLKGWYKNLSDAMKKRTESGDNATFKNELDRLQGEYSDYVRQAQEEIELFRNMGVIGSASASAQEQSASVSAMERITTDQAEEIIGRLNAGQIIWQQHKDLSSQILLTLTSMNEIVSGGGRSLGEMVTLMQTANGHLASIVSQNKKIYDDFGLKLDTLTNEIKNSYA